MPIDTALLLCAGLGTRMGIIGKKLPKSLWPFFDSNIFDYQIKYLQQMGIKKIFVNTHYLAEMFQKYEKKSNEFEIFILYEPELLKSGGTIHSLLKNRSFSSEHLLVVNSDQFYFPSRTIFHQAKELIKKYNVVLFPLRCRRENGYNQLVTKNNILINKISNNEIPKNFIDEYQTYSGMCLINMQKLNYQPGVSEFFDTVANFKQDQIYVIPPGEYQYYDFGTAEKYFETCFEIAQEFEVKKSDYFFSHFSDSNNMNKVKKCIQDRGRVLNFTGQKFYNNHSCRAIILNSKAPITITGNGLYYDDIVDSLST